MNCKKRILPFFAIFLLLAGVVYAGQEEAGEGYEKGYEKALFEKARLYEEGNDTIQADQALSTALYLEAARLGYAPAMNFIGFKYYTGRGVRKDIDSTLYWIGKAAEAGDMTAATNLGYLLTEGDGVTHDEEEAARWLTKAAEAGVGEAQVNLWNLMGEKWRELTPDSAMLLGRKYYIGASPILGVKFLEMAGGESNGEAYALLGDAYSTGRGVAYDHEKSVEYFLQGALAGNPSAQYILAELLDIFPDAVASLDTGQEYSSAQYWYDKAAAGGVFNSEQAYLLLYSPEP